MTLHLLVIKAGQLFILGPPMLDFHDPDGDELYYSCNIGSMVLDKDDDGVPRAYWTFQTNLPGFYIVQITAFDQRGGLTQSNSPSMSNPGGRIRKNLLHDSYLPYGREKGNILFPPIFLTCTVRCLTTCMLFTFQPFYFIAVCSCVSNIPHLW